MFPTTGDAGVTLYCANFYFFSAWSVSLVKMSNEDKDEKLNSLEDPEYEGFKTNCEYIQNFIKKFNTRRSAGIPEKYNRYIDGMKETLQDFISNQNVDREGELEGLVDRRDHPFLIDEARNFDLPNKGISGSKSRFSRDNFDFPYKGESDTITMFRKNSLLENKGE